MAEEAHTDWARPFSTWPGVLDSECSSGDADTPAPDPTNMAGPPPTSPSPSFMDGPEQLLPRYADPAPEISDANPVSSSVCYQKKQKQKTPTDDAAADHSKLQKDQATGPSLSFPLLPHRGEGAQPTRRDTAPPPTALHCGGVRSANPGTYLPRHNDGRTRLGKAGLSQ